MAVVTRADCTQIQPSENTQIKWTAATSTLEGIPIISDLNFNACTGLNANNNLFERVRKLHSQTHVTDQTLDAVEEILVGSGAGECNAAIESFLETKNITKISA